MILGTGIDLVDVRRIEKLYKRFPSRFMERVFTEAEAEYIYSRKKSIYPLLAARFAAKEATLKALGCGIGPASLKEVEVISMPGKAPQIKLHGNAAQIAARQVVGEILVSLTHEKHMACAQITTLKAPK